MKGKVSKNKFLKVVLPALLVVAIICQAVGFQAVLAKGNVATTSLMTYPNVQITYYAVRFTLLKRMNFVEQ